MQDKLHEIRVFENFQEELFETGHVIVTTKVVEKSLNYFGNAHGGYLFTLCDQVAGLVASRRLERKSLCQIFKPWTILRSLSMTT